MREYIIKRDLKQVEMCLLWHRYLKQDRAWHFFHEGTYAIIRTSETNKRLEKALRKMKINFERRPEWGDGSRIVEKYKKQFTEIFHAYSEMAMIMEATVPEQEKFQNRSDAFGRAIHCFCNMNGIDNMNESYLAMTHFFNRTHFVMHMAASNTMSEFNQKLEAYNKKLEESIKHVDTTIRPSKRRR